MNLFHIWLTFIVVLASIGQWKVFIAAVPNCPGLLPGSQAALSVSACSALNTVTEIKIEVNGVNGSVEDPAFMQSVVQLHDCGLVSLSLHGNALAGSITETWGNLTNLMSLNLAKNFLHGTIPAALGNLRQLMVLSLSSNLMHGTIPAWLGELPLMASLSLAAFQGRNPGDGRLGLVGSIPAKLAELRQLQFLALGFNSLTGTLPEGLCTPLLQVLTVSGNRLSGDSSLQQLLTCPSLWSLDLSKNNFSGSLPDIPDYPWKHLASMDLSSNSFEGTIPTALYKLPSLYQLVVANNRFSGTIHKLINSMPYMVNLNLRNNSFSGTIEEGIWYIPNLVMVDLSDNQFTGTISPALGMSPYLSIVKLANNMLTGRLPPELGLLSALAAVDVSNNNLSCNGQRQISSDSGSGSGGTRQVAQQRCPSQQLLPCILNITQELIPRPDDSHMKCPLIYRKPWQQAMKDCSSTGPAQLGDRVSSMRDLSYLVAQQSWQVDPAYYQYTGCHCLGGYREVWDGSHTSLSCQLLPPEALPAWVVPLAAALSSGCILLAAVSLLVWLSMTARLRRKWQRDKELKRYRLQGLPTAGPASIVVTDVEGYSELMRQDAPLCVKALGIHNAILRKAVSAHAGHVIEQEGDSWSVAFHRAVDAAAFCLQVQQALQKSLWPDYLGGSSSDQCNSSFYQYSHGTTAAASQVTSAAQEALTASSVAIPGQQGLTTAIAEAAASQVTQQHRWLSRRPFHKLLQSRARALPAVESSSSNSGAETCPAKMGNPGRTATANENETQMNGPSPANNADTCETHQLPSATTGPHSVGLKDSSSCHPAGHGGVRGLRVRMGLATGTVPPGRDIKTSALFQLAKCKAAAGSAAIAVVDSDMHRLALVQQGRTCWDVLHPGVSEMAVGGQILLEAQVFAAICDWLEELGSVDHRGYNDRLATTFRPPFGTSTGKPWKRTWWLAQLLRIDVPDRDPLVLDMGQFWMPSFDRHSAAGGSTAAPPPHRHEDLSLAAAGANMEVNATQTAAASQGCPLANHCIKGVLQLYTIVARPLCARVKAWPGRIMNFNDGVQQIGRGFLEAPAASLADLLQDASSSAQRPVLPAVTIVFAAVHGGDVLVRKKGKAAQAVHQTLVKLMQATLLALSDGYLCREQEAVMKYMLAFSGPARAAEWCLVMQDVLQHMVWLVEATEAPASHRTTSTSVSGGELSDTATNSQGASGRRCLAMKMALAEGVPEDISPDTLGRADYFGPGVNLAARLMAAATPEAPVVVSSETAQAIFR
eukprot:gene7361-7572_t